MATGSFSGDSWSSLFGALKEVRKTWPSRGWSWDGRLSCATSSFSVELVTTARTSAAVALTTEWSSTTIQQAPPALREVAERTGGLRAGQLILGSAVVGRAFAFGLWWPWGDGMTTSMRIGLGGIDATPDAFQRLREVFRVEL